MLNTPAEFPHPGSPAFIAPDGAAARIIRRNLDDTALVALLPSQAMPAHQARALRTQASGNRTVPLGELYATQEEAIHNTPLSPSPPKAPPVHKRARRATRKAR